MASKPPSNLPSPSGGKPESPNVPSPKTGVSLSKQKNADAEPLAPKSFKNPKPKKGNGKKVMAVVFGSLVVMFLMGTIGLVVFRLFIGNQESTTQSDTNFDAGQPNATESDPKETNLVDLGSWTATPTCIDYEKPEAWITDTDDDLLTNAEERLFGTDPCNPDTSGDGLLDGEAINAGQDPLLGGRLDYAKYGLPDPELN